MKKITTLLSALMISAFGFQSMAQITTYPYLEDFDTGAGGWIVNGTTTTWALGVPAGLTINSAASGTDSWVTNLTGLYSTNENGWVESPVFDLTAVPNPEFRANVWWDSENSWDGMVLQSSINAGATWQNVGAFGDPNNWFTDNSINGNPGGQQEGWTGRFISGSGGWVPAVHALNGLGGQASVILRMAFGSDGSVQDDGCGFDDVQLYNVTCPGPDSLDANPLSVSADLIWHETGTATAWEVEWGAAGFTATGTPTITGLTATTTNITLLSPITAYDFYVRSVCGPGDSSFWSGPYSFLTNCATMPVPFLDDFEAHTPTTFPGTAASNCWNYSAASNYDWNITGSGTTGSGGTGASSAHSGTNYFYTEASGAMVGATAVLTSPLIDVTTLTNPVLKFYYHMYGANQNVMGTLEVEVFDGTTWVLADSIVAEQQTNQTDTFRLRTVYSAGLTGITQIRFTAISNGSFQGDICIDDVSVVEGPPCPEPGFLAATNVLVTAAVLNWVENGSATIWDVEYGALGHTVGTGTIVAGTTTNPYNLTGLTPNTAYDFYVRAQCGGSDTSVWSGPVSFKTLCDPNPIQAPYADGFEGGTFDCWNVSGTSGLNYTWLSLVGPTPNFGTGPSGASTGDTYAYVEASFGFNGDTARLETPAISLTGITNTELKFSYHMFGNNIDTLYIQVNNGSGFVTVDTIKGAQQFADTDPWLSKSVDLSTYDGSASIVVGFMAIKAGFSGDIGIDDFVIAEKCVEPTAGVISTLTSSTTTIGWSTSGTAGLSWTIEYGPTGFSVGTGSVISGTTFNPHPLAGLIDSTGYDFYIRSNCALNQFSPWAGPFSFDTPPVGVDENTFVEGVSILPNPNNGVFTVNVATTNAKNITVEVTNTQGQIVFEKNNASNNENIDLSENAKGIYFVTVTSDLGVTTQKIIVQ